MWGWFHNCNRPFSYTHLDVYKRQVSGYSKVVAGEDFQAMMVHARKKMKDARTKILNGDVGALPYKR